MIDKIKKNSFLLISTFLVLYFFFNLLDGERGLISYFNKKNLLKDYKDEKINLEYKIQDLELKNSLLSDNLDKDYVEILIREKFIYNKNNEKIYVIKNDN